MHGEGAVTRESAVILLKRGMQPIDETDPVNISICTNWKKVES
jgi:hypothetical protein